MTYSLRLTSAVFSAIPALMFGAVSLFLFRDEYFWTTYVLMSLVFIGASICIGIISPFRSSGGRVRKTWIWLLVHGILACLVALLALMLLNSTPLCIGRDNGDGTNTLTLCFLQTIGVVVTFTPLELILLGISAIVGGYIIDSRMGS
jgi:hypothetical protein